MESSLLEFQLKKLRTKKIEINIEIKEFKKEIKQKIDLGLLSEIEYKQLECELKFLEKEKKSINKAIQIIQKELKNSAKNT